VTVKPLSKRVYTTSLDALKEAGIEIYFVNKTQFDNILLNKNEVKK
jgi:hypothetical protein